MKIVYLQILILLCLISTKSFGQNELQLQKNYADSLFNSENYFDAITEYKRLYFFDEEKIFAYESNFKIGVSYKLGGWYDNAIKYFSIASLSTNIDEQKYTCNIQIVRCNILRHTTERAIELLSYIENSNIDSNKLGEINYWRGWAYMFADSFKTASRYFALLKTADELKKLCDNIVNQKYSVNFAKTISFIIPGSGHVYTGNYFQGILSLGWNVLWGYLTINSFIQERALDGILIGGLLWLRFYAGGSQSAEQVAIEKNQNINNEALLYLQNNYKGIKP